MSPQNRKLLSYLKRWRSITHAQAFNDLGIARLAARVPELVAAGHVIVSERIEVRNRYGSISRPARYVYNGSQGSGAAT